LQKKTPKRKGPATVITFNLEGSEREEKGAGTRILKSGFLGKKKIKEKALTVFLRPLTTERDIHKRGISIEPDKKRARGGN